MKVQYSKLRTETNNPRSRRISDLPAEKILRLMNKEDQGVPRAVAKVQKQIAAGVKIIVASFKKGGRVFFAGAGTSGRLGVIEAAELPPTFSTPPSLVQAFIAGGPKAVFQSQEGAEDREDEGYRIFSSKIKPNDVVIGIAASGVTPFVAGVLRAANQKKAKTILITCTGTSPYKKEADCFISPVTGPEVITGSTRLKAGTATKLVLNMLTVTSMIQMGKVYQNWMVDLQPKSRKLRARALGLIEKLGGVSGKEAAVYFEKAKFNAKLAICMARTGWDYKTAFRKLKQNSGFLHKTLAEK